MRSVLHLGTKVQVLFGEQDADGNLEREIPIGLSSRIFSFEAYLDLFRQAWEQRNEVRKGCGLDPLPLPDAYEAAVSALKGSGDG